MIRTLSLTIAMITSLFSFPGASPVSDVVKHAPCKKARTSTEQVRRLAGPYAAIVRRAAQKANISPVLVAAVVYVENGGDFVGSTTRVSSAGAIGVMQLEPATAWDALHVNPWQAASNIAGGTRFLRDLLQQFHGNVRLALMAYNAGPTLIADGGRPAMAVWYAQKVIRLTRETHL